jgi:hypothetical protein
MGAAVSLTVLLCIPASRHYVLCSVGRMIVFHQHPPPSADVIVVAIDVDGAGTLEAADFGESQAELQFLMILPLL